MNLTIFSALDLNDNGRLAWPDFLGWTVLITLGSIGVAVLTLVCMLVLVSLIRTANAARRGTAVAVHRVASSLQPGGTRT